MKNLILFSIFLAINIDIFSQSTIFSYTNNPSNQNVSQAAVIASAALIPHIGAIQFIQFSSISSLGSGNMLNIIIPTVQNGLNLQFTIDEVLFANENQYSIQCSNVGGNLTLYITPEGIGGVIDIEDRKFTIYPLGGDNGLIFENNMSIEDGGNCATDGTNADHNIGEYFCHGDCGPGILDVLVLRTNDVNQWLWNRWNIFAEWFLFVETHNINGAFFNSRIPNKTVRVSYANFTPDFIFTSPPNPDNDLISVANSLEAQRIRAHHRADIVVLLTNRNYPDIAGISFFGVNSDPNNYCIAEVGYIDPSRFTMAHELAHQFGCDHSLSNPTACPHGMNLENGRNTIMAFAATNSRIQHYSNPNINFGGQPTGVQGTRDNAQQIRAAFCESVTNNTQPTFAVSFTPNDKICFGEPAYFSSNVTLGRCPVLPLGLLGDCGLPPYIYEWSISFTANFFNSGIVGTNADLELEDVGCPFFYLRLTVTSSDGMISTFTKRIKCVYDPCPRISSKGNKEKEILEIIPNPVQSTARILFDPRNPISNIECLSTYGQIIHIPSKKFIDIIEINTNKLICGIYYLILKINNEVKTVKMVVE